MTEAVDEEPGFRHHNGFRGRNLRSGVVDLQPDYSFVLDHLQPVGCRDALQQWKHFGLADRLMKPKRRAAGRDVAVRDVQSSHFGECSDHGAQIDILKVDQDPGWSLSYSSRVL